jgi:branched-chain amino acid transport system ATP-binding protein
VTAASGTSVSLNRRADSTPILEARGISAGYHGHAILRDLDFTVHPGEVVALLGPNGAGKTTTLLTMAGELKPLCGEVWFRGERTTSALHRRAKHGMAFVTEERSVFMQLSTSENLSVGRCDIPTALGYFPELRPLLKRRAGLLSGGEQQMLTLARALARKPLLLLADELSLGLAPLIVQRLLEAVKTAAVEQDVAVLLVEQHVHQALRVADRVLVMRGGSIVVQGTPREVEDKLEQAYLSGHNGSASADDASDSPSPG